MTQINTQDNMHSRIEKISADIKLYRQAIEDAEGALEAAERELDEVLETCYQTTQEGNEYV